MNLKVLRVALRTDHCYYLIDRLWEIPVKEFGGNTRNGKNGVNIAGGIYERKREGQTDRTIHAACNENSR